MTEMQPPMEFGRTQKPQDRGDEMGLRRPQTTGEVYTNGQSQPDSGDSPKAGLANARRVAGMALLSVGLGVAGAGDSKVREIGFGVALVGAGLLAPDAKSLIK